jgi:hypothetical protein
VNSIKEKRRGRDKSIFAAVRINVKYLQKMNSTLLSLSEEEGISAAEIFGVGTAVRGADARANTPNTPDQLTRSVVTGVQATGTCALNSPRGVNISYKIREFSV